MFVSNVVGLHYSNILQAMLHTAQSIGSSARAGGMSENLRGGALCVEIGFYVNISNQTKCNNINVFMFEVISIKFW